MGVLESGQYTYRSGQYIDHYFTQNVLIFNQFQPGVPILGKNIIGYMGTK